MARVLGVRSILLSSLHGYRSSWMMRDLVAALTLLAIAVPEQLATAFIAGSVMFALLGSNPQMSVGADSTIAPLFAIGIAPLASAISPHYVELVGIVAVMVGVFSGRWIVHRLPQRVFDLLMLAFAAIAALRLIFS